MSDSDYRVSADPVGCLPEILLALILVVVIGFPAYVWYAMSQQQKYVATMQHNWDAGRGRSQAVTLTRGSTVHVPAVAQVNDLWSACPKRSCDALDATHYPTVVPIGVIPTGYNNCLAIQLSNRVSTLQITATAGSVFSATFSRNGDTLTLCGTLHSTINDEVVFWSDDHAAAH